jgi:hypothetical protein
MSDTPARWPIHAIVVGPRHRRDLGDTGEVIRRIAAIGLSHPIVLTPDTKLIAGERRLAACKQLSWTARDLFGLHPVPAKPHPSFQRLSCYDSTGLVWLLHGRPVVKMTADSAAIRATSGGTVVYRKLNKPALGPLGDSLDDMGALR